MSPLNLIAGPHTARAGDTGCVVEGEERIRVIAHGSALAPRPVGIPDSIDAACKPQFAQWPRRFAIFRLFGHIQFDDIVAMPPETIALGLDDHIGSDWRRTGGGSPGLPVNFTDTESTGTEGSEVMRDAEAGYRNPGLPRSHIDGIARLGGHRLAIDIKLHRFLLRSIRLKVVKFYVIKSSSRKILPLLRLDDIQTFRLFDDY
jgi:hypothetical protein